MKTTTLLLAVSLGLAFATPGGEAGIFCGGVLYQVDAGTETIYIDDRTDDPNAPPGSGFIFGPGGTWIYLESNGIGGLQRGGNSPLEQAVPGIGGADPCPDGTNPDTLIF